MPDSPLLENLRMDHKCLLRMMEQAGFAGEETGIRVRDPKALSDALASGIREIERLQLAVDQNRQEVGKLHSQIAAKDSELAKLREENEWKPIASCPFRERVDLWCVYGGEEFAQFEGGASIGMVVSNRIKTKEYGFFGNQSNDGVPRKDGKDLVPVAWRRAVPSCPATLIAEVLGIPLTLEEALAKEQADA